MKEINNQLHALKQLVQKLNTAPLNEASTIEGLTILEQGIQEVLENLKRWMNRLNHTKGKLYASYFTR